MRNAKRHLKTKVYKGIKAYKKTSTGHFFHAVFLPQLAHRTRLCMPEQLLTMTPLDRAPVRADNTDDDSHTYVDDMHTQLSSEDNLMRSCDLAIVIMRYLIHI